MGEKVGERYRFIKVKIIYNSWNKMEWRMVWSDMHCLELVGFSL